MAKNRKRIERFDRVPKYRTQPTILIICEDTKSSVDYLSEAVTHYGLTSVTVTHVGYTDPLGILNGAIKQVNKYDELYCVIDRDRHTNFNDAIAKHQQLAQKDQTKIRLIVSFPCFEYWLLLHNGYTRKPYMGRGALSPCDEVKAELKRIWPNYNKGRIQGLFKDQKDVLPIVIERARRAIEDADQTNQRNPSTQLHVLIERLASLETLSV